MKRSVTVRAAAAFVGVSCIHRSSPLAPVACPRAPLSASETASRPLKIDGPPPTPIFDGPYSIVLDERIVAVIRDPADSVEADRAAPPVDPATIKAIEVIRAPIAHERYPRAFGDVLRITRCYPPASSSDRPNER